MSLFILPTQYGRLFLDLFLRSAMPALDSCFRDSTNEVVNLLKTLQHSTRLLQHVCTHSKVSGPLHHSCSMCAPTPR